MPAKNAKPSRRNTKSAKTGRKLNFDAHSMLTSVGAGRSTVRHEESEVVFRQGDPADAVFFIEKGRVRLTVVSEQGREGVIAMLGTGEFFGEGCLAGQPMHMASAVTTAASEIIRVEKGAMVRLLHEQPSFSEMFMAFLLARNVQFEEDLVDQLFNSSEKRLARILLLLANFGKDGKLEPVIPKISQEVLAARVGTTRSRINYFMNKFRKLGLIEYNGHLKVHTALLNVIIHD